MKAIRLLLAALGVAVGAYGAILLLERPDDLVAVGIWLFGGVALHDAVLAPLVLGLCLLGSRLLPQRFTVPAAMTLTIFGSLTLVAIPVLTRFGAKADNPTLLDRNYLLGWLLLGALTLAGTLLVSTFTATRTVQQEPEEV